MTIHKPGAAMAQRKNTGTTDYFPTPPWATEALLKHLDREGETLGDQICLEPAAGGGHMVDVLATKFGSVEACDISDPENRGWGGTDYLTSGTLVAYGPGRDHPARNYDWIITNPPFKLAEQFILKAIQEADRGVAMLCRTVFLESRGRYERLFSKRPPHTVLVFSERVTMVEGRIAEKGVASATSYSWFIWYTCDDAPAASGIRWVPPR
ncbi:MAG: SAM-dependent DNA methyltransferase [Rhodospirillales bacterium]|nr:SAM-dependent DNA methyltransferase [Rhodospirillales bacterium]